MGQGEVQRKWFFSEMKLCHGRARDGIGKCVQKRAHRNYVNNRSFFLPFSNQMAIEGDMRHLFQQPVCIFDGDDVLVCLCSQDSEEISCPFKVNVKSSNSHICFLISADEYVHG